MCRASSTDFGRHGGVSNNKRKVEGKKPDVFNLGGEGRNYFMAVSPKFNSGDGNVCHPTLKIWSAIKQPLCVCLYL